MIFIDRVSKSFGNNQLFNDLSIQIPDGEFICFTGESGKGKTTLLNMIGQIEPIDGGRITYDGREYLSQKEKQQFFGEKCGFLFQNFALIEGKTVRENLDLIPQKYRTEMTPQDILKFVRLTDKIDERVYRLSGGEQQRIALARLFLKKCDIVLADEPTGSLDRTNAMIVMNLLQHLNELGKTIILVTHDEFVRGYAKRIVEL